jgi:chemotaxis family two-component system response regulator Rcp1
MHHQTPIRPVTILLVEDNPADVMLTKEAFKESKIVNTLNVAIDGEEATDYLRKLGKFKHVETPDLVLLDLNLPKKNGLSVLAEVKSDQHLKSLPIIILSTSASDDDISKTYAHHANCYITKPTDFRQFLVVVKSIEDFWLKIAKLPKKKNRA